MLERLTRRIATLESQVAALRDAFGEEIRALRWRLYHDRLTGLANESALLKHLDQARSAWFVSIDLDDFKRAQDRAGSHALGNKILRGFARYLRRVTRQEGAGRPGDLVAYRPHGDEFIVVSDSEEGARRIAARVARWKHHGVTASAGVGPTLDAADTDMYRHKERRRCGNATAPSP